MASAISYELLVAKSGAANGLATLDATTKVPIAQLPAGLANGVASLDGAGLVPLSQLPASTVETYKGQYATSVDLIAAYPAASLADYAYVTATSSYWYWNDALLPAAAWVDQQITEAAYLILTAPERAGVPYIVV